MRYLVATSMEPLRGCSLSHLWIYQYILVHPSLRTEAKIGRLFPERVHHTRRTRFVSLGAAEGGAFPNTWSMTCALDHKAPKLVARAATRRLYILLLSADILLSSCIFTQISQLSSLPDPAYEQTSFPSPRQLRPKASLNIELPRPILVHKPTWSKSSA